MFRYLLNFYIYNLRMYLQDKDMKKCVLWYCQLPDRIQLRWKGSLLIYPSTAQIMEEEIDKFYSTLDNAKVRKEQVGAIVVKFKLGTCNKWPNNNLPDKMNMQQLVSRTPKIFMDMEKFRSRHQLENKLKLQKCSKTYPRVWFFYSYTTSE